MAFTSLGDDDRRKVDAWFAHLANWKNDPFVRSKSRKLEDEDGLYSLQTSSDIVIVFMINDDSISVISMYGSHAVDAFRQALEGQRT